MRAFHKRLLLLSILLFALGGVAWYWSHHQNHFDTEAHYTKREFRIPMRDGVKLFTQVYIPKESGRGPYPFLVARTPFGAMPYGEQNYRQQHGPSDSFDRSGYIFVFQDARGRFQSEGTFVDMRPSQLEERVAATAPGQTDESTDTYDSIDWLLKNVPGSNGSAGVWGISYQGF